MSRPKREGITLRNFRLPDEVFFEFEYLSEELNSTSTAEMVKAMRKSIEAYKKKNPLLIKKDGRFPLTKSRIRKMKQPQKA